MLTIVSVIFKMGMNVTSDLTFSLWKYVFQVPQYWQKYTPFYTPIDIRNWCQNFNFPTTNGQKSQFKFCLCPAKKWPSGGCKCGLFSLQLITMSYYSPLQKIRPQRKNSDQKQLMTQGLP